MFSNCTIPIELNPFGYSNFFPSTTSQFNKKMISDQKSMDSTFKKSVPLKSELIEFFLFPFYVLLFKHQMLLNFFYSALKLMFFYLFASLNIFYSILQLSHSFSLLLWFICMSSYLLFLIPAWCYKNIACYMFVYVWKRGREFLWMRFLLILTCCKSYRKCDY